MRGPIGVVKSVIDEIKRERQKKVELVDEIKTLLFGKADDEETKFLYKTDLEVSEILRDSLKGGEPKE